ncbi:dTDP-4-dehydrorhamnose 3,5-epimerase [Winogradskyella sp.]|jgi:dTDP-4-dehydrorhamnose 3,5-epimerase|uniref:dTDP-4-dehydrorhamnose 3,5-epimerase n=1 Tax=Winogradskyella sp. TaxID=1883156 RepID=UPI0025CFDB9D|nr:dTDP-4-dehydrorhamnose 3,5-epimerase [Winogradskyella sp.]MCT4628565.1 dTDP-4-dehydrorhamnose 3,5-epimerase [Winogradskyella sp.]
MNIIETKLKGCFIIEPKVFGDSRGYFFESFNQNTFNDSLKLKVNFVQDNESFSSKGVIRGLHYQKGEFAQAKLVRVVKGCVLDVVVDIRENSKTFGEHFSIELSEDNKKQLFIPKGFAHGFLVLSDTAIFSYKCDNYYNKASEGGIIYNDKTLNIDWNFKDVDLIISEKDTLFPNFNDAKL